MNSNKVYEKELAFQADRRRAAVEFIKIVSDLWYDKSIELVLFRNQLIDRNVSDILNLHEYAGEFVQKPISIFDSVEIAHAIKTLGSDPKGCRIVRLWEDRKITRKRIDDPYGEGKPATPTCNCDPWGSE